MIYLIGIPLVMFAGCGVWLYRMNDTGGKWWPDLSGKENEKDLY